MGEGFFCENFFSFLEKKNNKKFFFCFPLLTSYFNILYKILIFFYFKYTIIRKIRNSNILISLNAIFNHLKLHKIKKIYIYDSKELEKGIKYKKYQIITI